MIIGYKIYLYKVGKVISGVRRIQLNAILFCQTLSLANKQKPMITPAKRSTRLFGATWTSPLCLLFLDCCSSSSYSSSINLILNHREAGNR